MEMNTKKIYLNFTRLSIFAIKKPWCWINAKVKLSVLRCGQVELSLSFRVRFECSKVDKCVLTSSLLIIKQGKYRKLKDEIDDFDFDDVVQQSLFLFLFMSLMFVLVHASIVWTFSWLQTCTYHSTPFSRTLHSLEWAAPFERCRATISRVYALSFRFCSLWLKKNK